VIWPNCGFSSWLWWNRSSKNSYDIISIRGDTPWLRPCLKCKKIKNIFAALSCLLLDVNFLHYAKFMHFYVLQYFSLLNLNLNISYFIFYRNVYDGLNVKNKNTFFSAFIRFGACQFLHYTKFMHFDALQYFR